MRLPAILPLSLLLTACSSSIGISPDGGRPLGDANLATDIELATDIGNSTWQANVLVEPVSTEDDSGLASSSKLRVTFEPVAAAGVDHYEIQVAETSTSSLFSLDTIWRSDGFPTFLTELSSDTEYQITVRACAASDCSQQRPSASGTGRTAVETWRLAGTGGSVTGVSKIIENGNVQPHAFRFGSWAGTDYEGRVQVYYLPFKNDPDHGTRIALTSAKATDFASSIKFDVLDGVGLKMTAKEPPVLRFGGTPQALPMTQGADVRVRLFEVFGDIDPHSGIGYIDSQDALGQDFHPGATPICDEMDYEDGGACEFSYVIGSDKSTSLPAPKIHSAMQFKIAYPTSDSAPWNGAVGTPMIFTAHLSATECSQTLFNGGYAVWDGTKWDIQYGSDGCPLILPQVQAPSPLHLGATRYKLYFTKNAMKRNEQESSVKPFTVIYGDAARTGDATVLDFEDWESSTDDARNIEVQWPDGTALSAEDESRLDDYAHILPTGDPSLQVMYSNVATSDSPVPFIGALRLMNP